MTVLLLVGAPLLAGVFLAVIGTRRLGVVSAVVAVAAPAFSFGAALAIAQALSSGRDAVSVDLGQWLPLRGADLALRVDASGVPIVIAFSGTATVIALLALREESRESSARFFVPFALFTAAVLGVLAAANLVVLLAAWGMAGAAVAQLARGRDASASSARDGASALVVARAGDACLLLATIALLTLAQTVDLAELVARVSGVPLVPGAQRVVITSSVLIAIAAAARAGLVPFTAWLPVASARSRSAVALALAPAAGALLLLRLLALVDADVLTVVAAIGAVTAVLASLACLAHPRDTQLRAAAEAGAAIAALLAGPTPSAAVLIASLVARVAGGIAPRRWTRVDGAASSLVLALAAALTITVPAAAIALAIAAIAAAVSTVLGSESGRAASFAARVVDPSAYVARSFAGAAEIAERGADGLVDVIGSGAGRAVAWGSVRARALGDASEWVSEALLVAGAVAIVAFWATR